MLKLKGKKELAKKLKKLQQKTSASIARRAVSAGARVIRDEAKRNAPEDSGTLKKAIKVKTRKFQNKMGFHAYVAVDHGKKAKFDAWYARFIEYGVQPHEIAPKNKKALTIGVNRALRASASHPGIPAQPFMRPAYLSHREKAVTVTGQKLWQFIEKAAKA